MKKTTKLTFFSICLVFFFSGCANYVAKKTLNHEFTTQYQKLPYKERIKLANNNLIAITKQIHIFKKENPEYMGEHLQNISIPEKGLSINLLKKIEGKDPRKAYKIIKAIIFCTLNDPQFSEKLILKAYAIGFYSYTMPYLYLKYGWDAPEKALKHIDEVKNGFFKQKPQKDIEELLWPNYELT